MSEFFVAGDYTWILVFAFIISFMDAFAIGANDVANSFATSVASRSVSLKTACIIACFAEALGAILLGSGVAETIRKGIVDSSLFKDRPDLLMLGMMCANLASSVWTLLATKYGLPVSTTHGVVGGIVGMAIAAFGFNSVHWGWDGLGKIIASWFISPVLAATVAGCMFLTVKYLVMEHDDAYLRAQRFVPVYVFFAVALIVFFAALKGAPALGADELDPGVLVAIAVGTGAVLGLTSFFVIIPRVKKYIDETPKMNNQWGAHETGNVKPESNREDSGKNLIAPVTSDASSDTELISASIKPDNSLTAIQVDSGSDSEESGRAGFQKEGVDLLALRDGFGAGVEDKREETKDMPEKKKKNRFVGALTKGVTADVHQDGNKKIQNLHAASKRYDPRAERVFSFIQVFTATCASFSHGANDLANALAPMATVYFIWANGRIGDKKFQTPIWQIIYCAVALDLGLVLYGYKIMRSLGNNITFHSPSRGFTMELGAMTTVLIASVTGIPVSTTHCITGATVGVGLTEGKAASINWRHVLKILGGWFVTVPAAALIAGVFYAAMAYSPQSANAHRGTAEVIVDVITNATNASR